MRMKQARVSWNPSQRPERGGAGGVGAGTSDQRARHENQENLVAEDMRLLQGGGRKQQY